MAAPEKKGEKAEALSSKQVQEKQKTEGARSLGPLRHVVSYDTARHLSAIDESITAGIGTLLSQVAKVS